MTNREKIIQVENVIYKLYVKEGRSKSYISNLFEIDRKTLSIYINKKGWIKGEKNYISPSNQKFINKNRTLIKSMLDNDYKITEIANKLKTDRRYLLNMIKLDKTLLISYEEHNNRKKTRTRDRLERDKEKSSFNYDIEDLPREEWKKILGYGYMASNMGRIKKYVKKYNEYMLIKTFPNSKNGRVYVKLGDKNLLLSRIIAHTFCSGYSKEKNTVNHIDGNIQNNRADNLEWISQGENNKKAYDDLNREKSVPYSKYGRFKKIILDDKYEFSSISALSRFLNVSETQARRYIDKETKNNYQFEFKY